MSLVIYQQRQKRKTQVGTKPKVAWLDEFFEESQEGARALAAISAYAFHCVAAALRAKDVIDDAVCAQQALDIFVWWLPSESTPCSLLTLNRELEPENGGATCQESPAQGYWLWLLFMSPFPVELVQVAMGSNGGKWDKIIYSTVDHLLC